jgi:hypothetical protein
MCVLNGLDGRRIRRFEFHSDARLGEIYNGQSDEQRRCGNDLEIEERLESHAPHLSERTGTRDSHYNR